MLNQEGWQFNNSTQRVFNLAVYSWCLFRVQHVSPDVCMMVFQKLLAVRKADAQLPGEVRSALVDSLYAPFASLVMGALSGGIIGAMVSIRANDVWLTLCCFAIFVSGIFRI